MKNVIDALEARGFIEAKTSEEIKQLAEKPLVVYIGFDPTADSLHLGNFVPIMGLAWFKRFGHTPIAIVGGATGLIGDPSGKSTERNLLDLPTLQTNLRGIQRSLEAVLKGEVTILNNYDWYQSFTFLDFLRDIGKQFRLSTMLAKESVKTRLASEEGISFTELSYQILQAYDFLHLYDTHKVTLQMGGSDQWGNITAGTELIRKMRGGAAYGMTFPLLTRSDGKKFGKSEEGAIWLNPEKLSVYEFYQYLYRFPDADIPKMLRMLTFMDLEEIKEIERKMGQSDYVANTAQKRLAEEVTRIVHGENGLQEALRVTQAAQPGSRTLLDGATLRSLAHETEGMHFSKSSLLGKTVVEVLMLAQLVESKSEARRLIAGGGVYLNNEKISNENLPITAELLIEGEFLLIGIGKKKKIVLQASN